MFHAEGPTFFELVHQALSSTEHGYDLLAAKFDHTPFCTPPEVLEPLSEFLAGGPEIQRALDVCCGTGEIMRVLRPLCREQVAGIDFSAGMLEEARKKLSVTPGEAEVRLVRDNVFWMPFHEEFDLVTCFGAFGHVEPKDERRFVRSIARTLRPGGRFLFATAELPPKTSRAYWMSRAFNATMHVRNAVWRPKFIMYYLTFMLPEVAGLLDEEGFDVDVAAHLFEAPYGAMRMVTATKRGAASAQ